MRSLGFISHSVGTIRMMRDARYVGGGGSGRGDPAPTGRMPAYHASSPLMCRRISDRESAPGSAWPERALAERLGLAHPRHHRLRGLDALRRRLGGAGAAPRPGRRGAAPRARSAAGARASTIVLSPGAALPRSRTAARPSPSNAASASASSCVRRPQAGGPAAEERAEDGARGPADGRQQRRAHRAQQASPTLSHSRASQGGLHGVEAPRHADAVVAVADGPVGLREQVVASALACASATCSIISSRLRTVSTPAPGSCPSYLVSASERQRHVVEPLELVVQPHQA